VKTWAKPTARITVKIGVELNCNSVGTTTTTTKQQHATINQASQTFGMNKD
jgi:hypothetical protein